MNPATLPRDAAPSQTAPTTIGRCDSSAVTFSNTPPMPTLPELSGWNEYTHAEIDFESLAFWEMTCQHNLSETDDPKDLNDIACPATAYYQLRTGLPFTTHHDYASTRRATQDLCNLFHLICRDMRPQQ